MFLWVSIHKKNSKLQSVDFCLTIRFVFCSQAGRFFCVHKKSHIVHFETEILEYLLGLDCLGNFDQTCMAGVQLCSSLSSSDTPNVVSFARRRREWTEDSLKMIILDSLCRILGITLTEMTRNYNVNEHSDQIELWFARCTAAWWKLEETRGERQMVCIWSRRINRVRFRFRKCLRGVLHADRRTQTHNQPRRAGYAIFSSDDQSSGEEGQKPTVPSTGTNNRKGKTTGETFVKQPFGLENGEGIRASSKYIWTRTDASRDTPVISAESAAILSRSN